MDWTVFWAAVGALASVATTAIAWVALIPARRSLLLASELLLESEKARRAQLSLELSARIGAPDMHLAMNYVGRMRDQYHGNREAMVDAFVAEMAQAPVGELFEWNAHRRTISKFFNNLRAMCKSGVLDEQLLADQLGKAAFELYADTVGPLDVALNRRVLRRDDFDDRNIRFCRDFLRRHFSRASEAVV